MKKIIPILFLFATTIGVSQIKIDDFNDEISFSKVYHVDLPKYSIIQKTNEWCIKNHKKDKTIDKSRYDEKITVGGGGGIMLTDKGYTIVIKGEDYTGKTLFLNANYLINIAFKDKRYRIKIDNFKLELGFDYSSSLTRLEDFLVADDYQTYVNETINEWENKRESSTKKAILKRILDKELSKKDFEQRTRISKQLLSKLEDMVQKDVASLFKYVSK